jgi:hypothetical protein
MPWSLRALLVAGFKGQCHEIFWIWFFSWISFPQDPDYIIRAVSNFFLIFAEIFAAQSGKWKKSSIRKFFYDSFGHLWVVELAYKYIFSSSFQVVSSLTIAPVVLSPVSLIPVVHLELRIYPRIFEKLRNGLNGILWGCGETDSWKKPEAIYLVTMSLFSCSMPCSA